MTIDRAIEILDPEYREHYDGMDEVNEACRMGMEALERTRWIPCSERMPEELEPVNIEPSKAQILADCIEGMAADAEDKGKDSFGIHLSLKDARMITRSLSAASQAAGRRRKHWRR